MQREGLTEQVLLNLIGKCDYQDILADSACTDRVRNEIDRLQASGGAMKPEDRMLTAALLQEIQTTLAAGEAFSQELAEMPDLTESVLQYPTISFGLVGYLLQRPFPVEDLALHKQDAWVVRELAALGLTAQGWES